MYRFLTRGLLVMVYWCVCGTRGMLVMVHWCVCWMRRMLVMVHWQMCGTLGILLCSSFHPLHSNCPDSSCESPLEGKLLGIIMGGLQFDNAVIYMLVLKLIWDWRDLIMVAQHSAWYSTYSGWQIIHHQKWLDNRTIYIRQILKNVAIKLYIQHEQNLERSIWPPP